MNFLDIIIPEYDCKEDYIKRLLHSISRQKNVDFREIGVIIVNDKSKNKLRKGIFKNFPKLNIKYFLKDKNEGVGLTRQYGLDRSSAKYVTFVDQDDELYGSDSLSLIIAGLKQSNLNFVCTNFIEEIKTSNGKITNYLVTKKDGRETLHGVFLKREFLFNNKIEFKPGYKVHDDFYIRRVIKAIESPVYSEITTYIWKYNPSSQVRKIRKYSYMVETYEEYMRATKESNEFMINSNRYDSVHIVCSILGLFIILESNLFDFEELKNVKCKYERELFTLISKANKAIELTRKSFDSIFKAQLELMKNIENNLVINVDFFDFINDMRNKYTDIPYKTIEETRFLDIIVPYYNISDTTIEILMNSIVHQRNVSLSEIGVIFVSDNSPTDISKRIINGTYPFLHIDYYKKTTNEGQGLARQFGVEKSTARYVTFVDQDDLLFGPDALSLSIASLKEHNPELLYTDYFRYNPTTGERKLITYMELSCLHGVFFEREKLIEKNIKFSDKFRMYEDTYYMIIAGRMLETKYLNYPTYIWKSNSSSQTAILNSNSSMMIVEKFDDYILANIEAVKFLINSGYKEEELSKEVLYILLCLLNSNLFSNKDVTSYEKKIYDYYRYIKELFGFSNENDSISKSIERVKKEIIAEVNFDFDACVKKLEEKYN